MIIMFSSFLSGLIIYNSGSFLIIGAVLTALFLIFYIMRYRLIVIYCILFMGIGIFTAFIHTIQYENKHTALINSNKYEGYVIDTYVESYTVKNYDKNYTVSFSLYKPIDIKPGNYISFYGKVKDRPDYKIKLMNSTGVNAYITCSENSIRIIDKNSVLLLPVKIKHKINSTILDMDKAGGGFICGLISGYSGDILYEDKSDFEEVGISHILAVSGFNLGVIYYFFTVICKRLSFKTRSIVILFGCFIYTAFSGFAPSILRAFIMICVATLAKMIKRPHDVLNGITLTAFIMLLFNSFYIYNAGFLFSFLATYGIILFKDDIDDRLSEKIKLFRDEISVSGAAILSTFPAVLWYRGVFSIASLIINIVISPVISILTILSFTASILFIITNLRFWFYPSLFIGEIFIKFIRLTSTISIPLYIGRPIMLFMICYYTFLLLYFNYIKLNIFDTGKKYIYGILIILIAASLSYHKPYLKINVLNVGQGDSILIETPKRHTILVDTGPEYKDYVSLREKVIPYLKRQGYGKLDMLLVTHFHNDHAGGLEYIANGELDVGKILAYTSPQKYNLEVVNISKGDLIKVDDVIINILSPDIKDI
jgi:competence protein ComEC